MNAALNFSFKFQLVAQCNGPLTIGPWKASTPATECLGGIVDYSITGLDLAEQLDLIAIERGAPRALRMDNGPELISNAIAQWACETERVFIQPGQPWKNEFVDSFNGRIRDKCLGVNQF